MENQEHTTPKPEETQKSKPKTKQTLPTKAPDLLQVAKDAYTVWSSHTELSLNGATRTSFYASIIGIEETLNTIADTQGARRILTQELKTVNTEINKSIPYVKDYISHLYSKAEAPTYYAQFGIVKVYKTYRFPTDSDSRSKSLGTMLRGLELNGLNDKPYGKEFWTGLKARFDAALAKSRGADGILSVKTKEKAQHSATIRKTLNAIILRLKSDYPQSYKSELRRWGFQKDKY